MVDMTNDGSAFIVTDDEDETDIYVAPRKLRNALNGDRVKVYVYAKARAHAKRVKSLKYCIAIKWNLPAL